MPNKFFWGFLCEGKALYQKKQKVEMACYSIFYLIINFKKKVSRRELNDSDRL